MTTKEGHKYPKIWPHGLWLSPNIVHCLLTENKNNKVIWEQIRFISRNLPFCLPLLFGSQWTYLLLNFIIYTICIFFFLENMQGISTNVNRRKHLILWYRLDIHIIIYVSAKCAVDFSYQWNFHNISLVKWTLGHKRILLLLKTKLGFSPLC